MPEIYPQVEQCPSVIISSKAQVKVVVKYCTIKTMLRLLHHETFI